VHDYLIKLIKKALMKLNKLLLINLLILGLISFNSCSEEDEMDTVIKDPMGNNTGGNNSGSGDNTGGDDNATAAPNFTLLDLNDQQVKLTDYQGKVVVLFFFGNTCPSCMAVAPSVQSTFVNGFSSDKVAVLGIDQWNGTKSSVQGFQSNTGVTFPLLLNGSSVASQYGTTYDQLAVVDKEGYVQFTGKRSASSDLSSAKAVVEEYINK